MGSLKITDERKIGAVHKLIPKRKLDQRSIREREKEKFYTQLLINCFLVLPINARS
jgi:hypothetical protein